MKISPLAFALPALGLVLSGCSGNGSSTSQVTETLKYVNGYIGSSNVHNAVVQAVPIDVQGQPETEIDDDNVEVYVGSKATSTATSFYSVKVDSDDLGGPLTLITLAKDDDATTQRCQIVAGCGTDWAYREEAPVAEDFELRASVAESMDNMRINVNWVTHLASAFAYTSYIDKTDNSATDLDDPTTPRTGVYTAFTIERANVWMDRMFGVVDVVSSRALEPADLFNDSKLSAALRPDAIYYGAIVAAGQVLAKAEGIDETTWVNNLVHDLLVNQGQFYQKGGSGTSLYAIYEAAYQVLSDNKTFMEGRSYAIPSEIGAVLTRLSDQMAVLEDGVLTSVSVTADEVDDWLDRINKTKVFVADLNERLLNWKGDDPDTCASGADQDDTSCVHSFVDPAYVAKTVAYYDGLADVYESAAPGMEAALRSLRDLSLTYISCLNTGCAGDSHYDADAETYTVAGSDSDDPLVFTYEGVAVDGVTADEGEFYAFDIIHKGTLTVSYTAPDTSAQTLNLTFRDVKTTEDDGTETTAVPRLRIVYNESFTKPPVTAVDNGSGQLLDINNNSTADETEPLGFDVSWPYAKIPLTVDGNQQTFELYVAAAMLGVRDPLDANTLYHYNLTSVSFQILADGADEGKLQEEGETLTLGDKAELTFTTSVTNSANYYADSVWPELDDFFRIRDGYEAGAIEPDLFKYLIRTNESVLYGTKTSGSTVTDVMRTADYIEVEINGYGINRVEVFGQDDVGEPGLRKCSVIEDESGNRSTETCTSVVTTDEKMTIQELVDSDSLGLFSIPARGAYRLMFPEDSSGNAILDTTGTEVTLDGRLDAVFMQGLSDMNLRMAHELVECADGASDCFTEGNDSFSRIPVAIVNISLTREAKDEWEVGITAGYDYDYLVDVLPTGTRAQSLYMAYAVGQDSTGKIGYEIADLIVFRGGVTLFTGNGTDGESVGVIISGEVNYDTEYTGTESPAPEAEGSCGVVNRKEAVAFDCEAKGYLFFRNSLVGVIREERDGVYVVRFSDGQFMVLGG
ncbi:hypothetical protein ACQUQU_06265 [Thalassolituus sp. LLYu03]|uniref:hypothetical protein n=1 Tax=Thalassolituus sp. LLYu03 TaxID=3421656 RepID=UPI003D2DD4EA